MKPSIKGLIGLAVVAGSVGVVAWTARDLGSPAGEEFVEVARSPFVREVQASGEVRSSNSVSVGCPSIPRMWNFTITHLTPEGQEVNEGDLLVSFDSKKLQEELQVKRSELDTTRKELEKTRLEEREKLERLLLEQAELGAKKVQLDRKLAVPGELQKRTELEKLKLDHGLALEEQRLVGLRIVAQRESMEARIGHAEGKVKRLERQVRQHTEHIGKMNVTASRAGFVAHSADWNGEKPKVGESIWKGRSVMEIADLTKMEVAAEVAEPDAGFVELNHEVELRLDASPDRLFKGRVKSLGRLFRTKSSEVPTMVFDTVVEIDEPDPELMKPGMAASVKILSTSEQLVMQVPETALSYTEEGPVVQVRRDNGNVDRVVVQPGMRWQGKVVIEGGLEEGSSVRVQHEG